MAGLVGSSNNPVSGITISTILVSPALLLLGMGVDSQGRPGRRDPDRRRRVLRGRDRRRQPAGSQVRPARRLHAVEAADDADPRRGRRGARRWRRCSTCSTTPTTSAATGLPAPQANLMGTVANGVFEGGLPWTIIGIGAAIAVVVIVIDSILEARKAEVPHPGDGVRGRRLPAVRPQRADLPGRRGRAPGRAPPHTHQGRRRSAAARSSGWASSPLPASSQARR